MLSRKYKCPICGAMLQERCLPYSEHDGEVFINYQLECDTCGTFGRSICNCQDSCLPDYHFVKAHKSLKESNLFLKDFILKGGFNE